MHCNIKKWIKSKDDLTKFEQGIINKYPENLLPAVVEGGRGTGKSMFCYLVTARIMQYLHGIHIDDAFPMALDHFLWTVPQTLKVIDKVIDNTDYNNILQYDRENKYRILVVDDAGTHMSKYRFYTDVASVDDLKGRLDTIRDVTCGLLLTTPAMSGLLSFLREYPDNKTVTLSTHEKMNTEYGRIVEIRNKRLKWARYGKRAYPPIKTSIFVYDWAYADYKRKKRLALKKLFDKQKRTKKNEIIKTFRVIRKLNPKITNEEIIVKLGLSEDVLSMFDENIISS